MFRSLAYCSRSLGCMAIECWNVPGKNPLVAPFVLADVVVCVARSECCCGCLVGWMKILAAC